MDPSFENSFRFLFPIGLKIISEEKKCTHKIECIWACLSGCMVGVWADGWVYWMDCLNEKNTFIDQV